MTINQEHIGLYIKGLKTDQYNRGTKLLIEINSQTQSLLSTCMNFCLLEHKYKAYFSAISTTNLLLDINSYLFYISLPNLLALTKQLSNPTHLE